ncbi:MAG: hypothetical protein OXC19_09185 [Bryobacterales bacterium]|nr:hypothetical protein [Bryobacterales bacterium]
MGRIDAEQVERPALERGGLGGNREGGLPLRGQADPIEDETGQVPQQGREAVRREALRRDLGGGLAARRRR